MVKQKRRKNSLTKKNIGKNFEIIFNTGLNHLEQIKIILTFNLVIAFNFEISPLFSLTRPD